MGIKEHIKEHKEAYIAGGVCLLVGAAGATLLLTKTNSGAQVVAKINQVGIWNTATQVTLVALGDPGDVLRITKTTPELEKLGVTVGMYVQSKGALARMLGVNPARITELCQGKIQDINGLVAEVVGKAGLPISV